MQQWTWLNFWKNRTSPVLALRTAFFSLFFCIILCTPGAGRADESWLNLEFFLNVDLPAYEPYPTTILSAMRKKADDTNDAEIFYILARMYDEGNGVTRDISKAESYYVKSAESGLIKAQLALGIFYNFKGDITKARKWFKQATLGGDAASAHQLGLFYDEGRGVFADKDKARKYFLVASKRGYAKASLKLALMHQHSEKPDSDTAINYYKLAVSQADEATGLKISILLAKFYASIAEGKGNDEEVLRWYLNAAELGDLDSQLLVASYYLNGKGTKVDFVNAYKWYDTAAKRGNPAAMTMLGYIYANGLGIDINYEEAVRWYTHAAERGDGDGAWSLGNMYLTGNGVERNGAEAKKWFNRADSLRRKNPETPKE